MPKFLNTSGLSEWISRIIEETEREIIIISPYLQLSDKVFQSLRDIDKRGVETTLIYRENKLSAKDKEQLKSIDNLNLMHHPNIHAKCFYNENFLLVGSMNLYEYSAVNNREMGILMHRQDIPEFPGFSAFNGNADDDNVFEEALQEIVQIINGAHLERPSRETNEDGFEMEILKTQREKAAENLKKINKTFVHKRFALDDDGNFICKNYMDKVDLKLAYRIEFELKFEAKKLSQAFAKFQPRKADLEFFISGFKFYWNKDAMICIYDDRKHPHWKKINTQEEELLLRKKGIDEVVEFIKKL